MGEPPASIPDRFNAAAFFVDRHMVEGRAGRRALYHEDRVVTYGEIFESVNRVGNALLDLGVQMEDRVLLILLDGPEFVASFFGAMKLGAVPVPVNTLMRAADYRFFLDDSRAQVAIVSEPLLVEAGPALAQARHLKHVAVVGDAKSHHLQFESWVSKASRSLEPADTSRDDVAFWLTRRARRDFRKGRSTCITTWSCVRTPTGCRCSASRSGIGRSRRRSCFSRMVSATTCISRCASARRRSCIRAGPPRRRCSKSLSGTAPPCSLAFQLSSRPCFRCRMWRIDSTSPRCGSASPRAKPCPPTCIGGGASGSAASSSMGLGRRRSSLSSSPIAPGEGSQDPPARPSPGMRPSSSVKQAIPVGRGETVILL